MWGGSGRGPQQVCPPPPSSPLSGSSVSFFFSFFCFFLFLFFFVFIGCILRLSESAQTERHRGLWFNCRDHWQVATSTTHTKSCPSKISVLVGCFESRAAMTRPPVTQDMWAKSAAILVQVLTNRDWLSHGTGSPQEMGAWVLFLCHLGQDGFVNASVGFRCALHSEVSHLTASPCSLF